MGISIASTPLAYAPPQPAAAPSIAPTPAGASAGTSPSGAPAAAVHSHGLLSSPCPTCGLSLNLVA